MNIGQRVLLIASWEDAVPVPPIGTLGTVSEPIDDAGDYYVLFDGHPCPIGFEPEWFTPHWAIVPVGDARDKTAQVNLMLLC